MQMSHNSFVRSFIHCSSLSVVVWCYCCSWRSASCSHRIHLIWTSHRRTGGVKQPLKWRGALVAAGMRSRASLTADRARSGPLRLATAAADDDDASAAGATTVGGGGVRDRSGTVVAPPGGGDGVDSSSKSGNWARRAVGRSATTSPRRSTSRSNAELRRRRWRGPPPPLGSVVSRCPSPPRSLRSHDWTRCGAASRHSVVSIGNPFVTATITPLTGSRRPSVHRRRRPNFDRVGGQSQRTGHRPADGAERRDGTFRKRKSLLRRQFGGPSLRCRRQRRLTFGYGGRGEQVQVGGRERSTDGRADTDAPGQRHARSPLRRNFRHRAGDRK